MAPSGHACKLWDDSTRRWHWQRLEGYKESLWAFGMASAGKESGKYSKCWKLRALKAGHVCVMCLSQSARRVREAMLCDYGAVVCSNKSPILQPVSEPRLYMT
ncbi:hypothetical protein HAX54_040319 [Datura stramonium]|uniref:Uncharacterized protein n=1 Tax=Datura stramonium TaxID=4076 RepID=A0ABS8VRD8_DATST|nr:hypothetical protein [Datura stramonium]